MERKAYSSDVSDGEWASAIDENEELAIRPPIFLKFVVANAS